MNTCVMFIPQYLPVSIQNDNNDIIAKCTEQDLKLNMMFTVAAMLTNVSRFSHW